LLKVKHSTSNSKFYCRGGIDLGDAPHKYIEGVGILKKRLVSGALTVAIALSPMSAFAEGLNLPFANKGTVPVSVTGSVYGNFDIENGFKGIDSIKDYQPLVQSVTPATGATVVRPDESVVIQLNTQSPEYKIISKMPAKLATQFINAYVLDGKTAIPIDKSLIQLDQTSGKITVQHPTLTRYTKYATAIQLGIGGQLGNSSADGKWGQGKVEPDVITEVDTVNKTVTLFNNGVIPISAPMNFGNNPATKYQVGDVVSVINYNALNGKSGKIIAGQGQAGTSTTFTTGSDLYEPTNVVLPNLNVAPSVLEDTKLTIRATDDYGLPAKANVSLTASENGSRLVNSVTMVQTPTELTDGSAEFVVSNHEAEPVAFTASVTGAYGVKETAGDVKYQPGPTDKLSVTPNDKYVVGQPSSVKGQALDIYDNTVKDGTPVAATSARGSVTSTQTAQGNFDIAYTPSTIKGNDDLSVTAGDSGKVTESKVYNRADKPAMIVEKQTLAKVGKTSKLNFDVKDQYGNLVENGEPIVLTSDNAALPTQTVNTVDGGASFEFIPTSKTAIGYKLEAQNGGFQFTPTSSLPIYAGDPAVIKAKTTEVKAGEASKIVFDVQDGYGNPVEDGEKVTLNFTGNVIPPQTTQTVGGQATFDVTIPSAGGVSYSIAAENGGFTFTPPEPLKVVSAIPTELAKVVAGGKNVLVVDPSGITGADGTPVKAVDVFTQAIELAKPGDGIYLKSGDYNITSNDVFWVSPDRKYSNMILRKSLTIVGESAETTTLIIDDSNSAFHNDGAQFAVTFAAPNIKLKNLTIHVKQQKTKSLWALFNVWGRWDGSTSRGASLENVKIITDSPVPYLFYMNDFDFVAKNLTVQGNGNIKNFAYWNFGTLTLQDSQLDMAQPGRVTSVNTRYNVPSAELE
jgi:hypothetical protein